MSRPRFLLDHDFNEIILRGLERREPLIEFLKVRDVGLDQKSDEEILAYAAAEQWIVISHDVTTMPAAAYSRVAAGQPMLGLILVRQQLPISTVIDDVIMFWAASEAEEWKDQVLFLSR